MASSGSSWTKSQLGFLHSTAYCRTDLTTVRKRKWADQIEYTLLELHRIGLVWGDAKAGNVVIDREDNAWLVDFGGGYTLPWMEPDLAGTPQGDVQAFQKIKEALEQ
jgi:RIO-like serine/threonine protein kinase